VRNRVFGDQPIPPTRRLCRGIALTRSGRQAGHHLRPPPVLADGPGRADALAASDSGAPNFSLDAFHCPLPSSRNTPPELADRAHPRYRSASPETSNKCEPVGNPHI
jgi:hypothetical protein